MRRVDLVDTGGKDWVGPVATGGKDWVDPVATGGKDWVDPAHPEHPEPICASVDPVDTGVEDWVPVHVGATIETCILILASIRSIWSITNHYCERLRFVDD